MTYQRLAYDDQDTAGQMHDDCTACASSIAMPRQRGQRGFVEQKRESGEIEISDAAVYLANRLHLHLD